MRTDTDEITENLLQRTCDAILSMLILADGNGVKKLGIILSYSTYYFSLLVMGWGQGSGRGESFVGIKQKVNKYLVPVGCLYELKEGTLTSKMSA